MTIIKFAVICCQNINKNKTYTANV